jgi:hypothetical protein
MRIDFIYQQNFKIGKKSLNLDVQKKEKPNSKWYNTIMRSISSAEISHSRLWIKSTSRRSYRKNYMKERKKNQERKNTNT